MYQRIINNSNNYWSIIGVIITFCVPFLIYYYQEISNNLKMQVKDLDSILNKKLYEMANKLFFDRIFLPIVLFLFYFIIFCPNHFILIMFFIYISLIPFYIWPEIKKKINIDFKDIIKCKITSEDSDIIKLYKEIFKLSDDKIEEYAINASDVYKIIFDNIEDSVNDDSIWKWKVANSLLVCFSDNIDKRRVFLVSNISFNYFLKWGRMLSEKLYQKNNLALDTNRYYELSSMHIIIFSLIRKIIFLSSDNFYPVIKEIEKSVVEEESDKSIYTERIIRELFNFLLNVAHKAQREGNIIWDLVPRKFKIYSDSVEENGKILSIIWNIFIEHFYDRYRKGCDDDISSNLEEIFPNAHPYIIFALLKFHFLVNEYRDFKKALQSYADGRFDLLVYMLPTNIPMKESRNNSYKVIIDRFKEFFSIDNIDSYLKEISNFKNIEVLEKDSYEENRIIRIENILIDMKEYLLKESIKNE